MKWSLLLLKSWCKMRFFEFLLRFCKYNKLFCFRERSFNNLSISSLYITSRSFTGNQTIEYWRQIIFVIWKMKRMFDQLIQVLWFIFWSKKRPWITSPLENCSIDEEILIQCKTRKEKSFVSLYRSEAEKKPIGEKLITSRGVSQQRLLVWLILFETIRIIERKSLYK